MPMSTNRYGQMFYVDHIRLTHFAGVYGRSMAALSPSSLGGSRVNISTLIAWTKD